VTCTWKIYASDGQLSLVFDAFNIQHDSKCAEDVLQVSPVKKYTKVKLCGAKVPSGFNLVSKGDYLVLKFTSDSTTEKTGFSAFITAIG